MRQPDLQRDRDFDHMLSGFVLALVVGCVGTALFLKAFGVGL